MGKGSCRSWGGFNLFAALESCSGSAGGLRRPRAGGGLHHRGGQHPRLPRADERLRPQYCGGQPPVSVAGGGRGHRAPGRASRWRRWRRCPRWSPTAPATPARCSACRAPRCDALQSVGQNRHLKLRLSKGSASLTAFSSPPRRSSCGWPRATGWTRPSTCRSTNSGAAAPCSCRWWTSAPPSAPAAGAGGLERWRSAGGGAPPAAGGRPPAAQPGAVCAAVALAGAAVPEEATDRDTLPLLRQLAGAGRRGALPARGHVAAVFAERGLLDSAERRRLTLRSAPGRRKWILEHAAMAALSAYHDRERR